MCFAIVLHRGVADKLLHKRQRILILLSSSLTICIFFNPRSLTLHRYPSVSSATMAPMFPTLSLAEWLAVPLRPVVGEIHSNQFSGSWSFRGDYEVNLIHRRGFFLRKALVDVVINPASPSLSPSLALQDDNGRVWFEMRQASDLTTARFRVVRTCLRNGCAKSRELYIPAGVTYMLVRPANESNASIHSTHTGRPRLLKTSTNRHWHRVVN